MADRVLLYGYRFSVYTRIVRMVLQEKGVAYDQVEIDPFSPTLPGNYAELHPFRRVPVLRHGDFTIYETGAIARYIDATFDGPCLCPTDARSLSRMTQAIAIMDSYGYRPMVRQVFAHRVFRPRTGEPASEAEIAEGLAAAPPVLTALEVIAAEGRVLDGLQITLADCHLAPMFGYYLQADRAALMPFPALSQWWNRASRLASFVGTEPGLPEPAIET
ncbi:glutathione S-transferase family protein [Consotaella aegiceratis]|uniref:glutathione S-transferase family protein n=1 Tax=Consotaella aegiceratis TaxID=3097961 RepID=UPI002F419CAE